MADKILSGQDWSVAGNWSPSGVPVDNDKAVISHTLQSDVNAGLDQSGIDLDLLELPAAYSRSLGSTGNTLRLAADIIKHFGSGPMYFEASAGGVADITDEILLQCANPGVVVELGSEPGDAGNVSVIVANRVSLLIKANILFENTLGQLIVGYVNNPSSDVRIKITSGADTLPVLDQGGGLVESEGAITAARVANGTLIQDVQPITTLDIFEGGNVIYNHSVLTTVRIHPGGVLDLMQNAKYKTITTAIVYRGGTLKYDSRASSLHTITTLTDYNRLTQEGN